MLGNGIISVNPIAGWVWNNPLITGIISIILTGISIALIIFMIIKKSKNKTISKKLIITTIILVIIIVLILWIKLLMPIGWNSLIK